LVGKNYSKYNLFSTSGTASVATAGVFASLRITGKKLRDNVFLFQGAGEVSKNK
jgi:malate dehydrogenase (oxaloacetate-decarboxylating)(NADP+)